MRRSLWNHSWASNSLRGSSSKDLPQLRSNSSLTTSLRPTLGRGNNLDSSSQTQCLRAKLSPSAESLSKGKRNRSRWRPINPAVTYKLRSIVNSTRWDWHASTPLRRRVWGIVWNSSHSNSVSRWNPSTRSRRTPACCSTSLSISRTLVEFQDKEVVTWPLTSIKARPSTNLAPFGL